MDYRIFVDTLCAVSGGQQGWASPELPARREECGCESLFSLPPALPDWALCVFCWHGIRHTGQEFLCWIELHFFSPVFFLTLFLCQDYTIYSSVISKGFHISFTR